MHKAFKSHSNPKLAEAVFIQIFGKDAIPTADGVWDHFMDILRDVINGGASAGVPGFIYTNDLFWKKHRKIIIDAISEYAKKLEQNEFEMISGWTYFDDFDEITYMDIAEAMFGKFNPQKFMHIYNAFAWFALEEVAFNT